MGENLLGISVILVSSEREMEYGTIQPNVEMVELIRAGGTFDSCWWTG